MQQIYLDNNSTTAIDPVVARAMTACMAEGFVNPASQHQMGQTARRKLEQIRSEILGLLGAVNGGMQTDQLVFTSGGTESNNLALIGLSLEPDGSMPAINRVLMSAIEHPSVIAAGEYLRSRGFVVEQIAVDGNGLIDLDKFEAMLGSPVRLVSVMYANNETGAIQPIHEIARLCKQHKAMLHSDAVQAVGKVSVEFSELDIDALSMSAHKFHGPRGVGGLILRYSIKPFPSFFGGHQQLGIRPGTEDVCLATGMLCALQRYRADADERQKRVAELRDRLQAQICSSCEEAIVNCEKAVRVPHTLNISFRGINRQQFLMAADIAGIAVSTGSACASGSSDPSAVLLAMGLENEVIESSIRISLSAFTTVDEIDHASRRIIKIAKDLRHQKSV